MGNGLGTDMASLMRTIPKFVQARLSLGSGLQMA